MICSKNRCSFTENGRQFRKRSASVYLSVAGMMLVIVGIFLFPGLLQRKYDLVMAYDASGNVLNRTALNMVSTLRAKYPFEDKLKIHAFDLSFKPDGEVTTLVMEWVGYGVDQQPRSHYVIRTEVDNHQVVMSREDIAPDMAAAYDRADNPELDFVVSWLNRLDVYNLMNRYQPSQYTIKRMGNITAPDIGTSSQVYYVDNGYHTRAAVDNETLSGAVFTFSFNQDSASNVIRHYVVYA